MHLLHATAATLAPLRRRYHHRINCSPLLSQMHLPPSATAPAPLRMPSQLLSTTAPAFPPPAQLLATAAAPHGRSCTPPWPGAAHRRGCSLPPLPARRELKPSTHHPPLPPLGTRHERSGSRQPADGDGGIRPRPPDDAATAASRTLACTRALPRRPPRGAGRRRVSPRVYRRWICAAGQLLPE
ncbi:hypothetical protein BS78_02G195300 [Paspalum vaginatum]|nr:hypothetical protein BS78_02G195300 [Paspalum vaginatum]